MLKRQFFPYFTLPPNEAVADYYTFCGGGASQSQSQLPSAAAIQDAVVELKKRVIPDKEPIEVFA